MSALKTASSLIKANIKSNKAYESRMGMFVAWFLKEGKSKIVTPIQIATFLATILDSDRDITHNTVRMYITNARKILETRKGMSIWCERGQGYTLASERQKANYLVMRTKATLKNAERATRLYVITDKKYIPEAVSHYFGSKAKADAMIGEYGKHLFAICNQTGQKRLANATA